jgi:hypothetical protein
MVSEMQIKFTSNGKTMQATLESNNAAKHFYQLLPLTLKVEDFANAEKIATLPDAGDITYYAPWGNLALFYKQQSYANGLIKLGKITGDSQFFKSLGQADVTIEPL